MTRLPRVTGRQVLGALRRGGFELTHIRGSHHYLRKPGADSLVVVPIMATGPYRLEPFDPSYGSLD